jgi:hypothetical protein
MKTVALSTAALLLAGAAAAQTAPQSPPQAPPSSSLTRDLNAGPPAAATYIAPAPAQAPAPVTPAPVPVRPRFEEAAPLPEGLPAPRVVTPIPTTPAPPPRMAPITPDNPPRARVEPVAPESAPTVVAPAPTPATPPPPAPNVPTVTVLDEAARAALPFTAELPRGFEIVTGRPGPNFRIYTIRRGERSFVMVYAGPNSQFPIYSGEQVEIPGRSSIVATEDGVRHAMEHLFRRSTDPLEVHVWTMTLDGADRALAEQIAQTIDVR